VEGIPEKAEMNLQAPETFRFVIVCYVCHCLS